MKKKKFIIRLIIAFLLVGIIVGFIYFRYIRIQNVFDEMYYTRVHKTFDWWSPGDYRGMFGNMPQLKIVGRDVEQGNVSEGTFNERYQTKYLEDDEELEIDFFSKKNGAEFYISYAYVVDNKRKWHIYCYTLEDRTLTYSTNDKEHPEKKQFLYDRFLNDWFEANEGKTRFSMDNLGKVTMRESE